MTKVFGVVEPIPHKEAIGCIEAHPTGLQAFWRKSFVKERTDVYPRSASFF